MDTNQIKTLIEQENEERQSSLIRNARYLISSIANVQEERSRANKEFDERIAGFRAELKVLEAQTITSTEILGE